MSNLFKLLIIIQMGFSAQVWAAKSLTISPPSVHTVYRYMCYPKYGDKEPKPLQSIYFEFQDKAGDKRFKRVLVRDGVFQDNVERHDWQETSFSFIKRWNRDGSIESGEVTGDFKNRMKLSVGMKTITDFSINLVEKGNSSNSRKINEAAELVTEVIRKSKLAHDGKNYDVFEIKETWTPEKPTSAPLGDFVQFYSPVLNASLKTQFFQAKGLMDECRLREIIELDLIKVQEN